MCYVEFIYRCALTSEGAGIIPRAFHSFTNLLMFLGTFGMFYFIFLGKRTTLVCFCIGYIFLF